jgi:hypothetical protein
MMLLSQEGTGESIADDLVLLENPATVFTLLARVVR